MIIRAIDAIFTWTPNRDLDETEINPLRGTVHVSTFPESAMALQHSNSFGACNIGWEQIDNRWRMAQWMVIEMIHRDNIPVDEVRRACIQTDEFAAFQFSIEAPEDDD